MVEISIIIPAYNSALFIEKSLRSITESGNQMNMELIVVDDGSSDDTLKIAKQFADKTESHSTNRGLVAARMTGLKKAEGEIIINTDSDVVFFPDTVSKIYTYFKKHPDVDAVTGRLSKVHPNADFFSQYKNLYMNYIFGKLPQSINFLYGSIHALRKNSAEIYCSTQNIGEDSERGQLLDRSGKKISFLKDLEVVHLKKYTFKSWVKNDYQVPFWWARLFLRYKGWQSLGKNKSGYLHSPKEQLASVAIGPLSMLFGFAGLFHLAPSYIALSLLAIWLILNVRFIAFLCKEKGVWFGIRSIFVTYLDHIIMATGIFFGLLNAVIKG